jgi:hypothetical protein
MRQAIEGSCESARVEEDVGTIFTLQRLLLLLYWCAQIGYSRDSHLATSKPSEKLLVMLERMELSRGFLTYRHKSTRASLMPQKDVVDHVLQSPERKAVEAALELSERGGVSREGSTDSLYELFQSYCSYGEPMNTTKLKASKLCKLLRDHGVIGKLAAADIDIVCAQLTSNQPRSSPGHAPDDSVSRGASDKRLDFSQFMKAVEVIAVKQNPCMLAQDAVVVLVDSLLQSSRPQTARRSQSELASQLMEMLEVPETVQALSLVHRSLVFYYRHYSDSRGFLNFHGFIVFCRDFSIFPDIIPKSKLQRIFSALAGIYAQTTQPGPSRVSESSRVAEQTEDEIIDEHLFVEGLALVASEVKYRQAESSIVQRLCCLMERLSNSAGLQKVLIAEGRVSNSESSDLLTGLKQVFPQYFTAGASRDKPDYQDLLTSLSA